MLALHDDSKIYGYPKEGKWVDLPNGDKVSPVVVGWKGQGYMISEIQYTPKPDYNPRKSHASSSNQIVDGVPVEVWDITPFPTETIEKNRIQDIRREYNTRIALAMGDDSLTYNLMRGLILTRKEMKGAVMTQKELDELTALDTLGTWATDMKTVKRQAIQDGTEPNDVVWP